MTMSDTLPGVVQPWSVYPAWSYLGHEASGVGVGTRLEVVYVTEVNSWRSGYQSLQWLHLLHIGRQTEEAPFSESNPNQPRRRDTRAFGKGKLLQ